mmetsp:Transcript_18976/g.54396  ORF Transcript_18976/g.54396 Transcript_18976/m.54396 type:complete len:251 (-) Transcript_18976:825-1577(-)
MAGHRQGLRGHRRRRRGGRDDQPPAQGVLPRLRLQGAGNPVRRLQDRGLRGRVPPSDRLVLHHQSGLRHRLEVPEPRPLDTPRTLREQGAAHRGLPRALAHSRRHGRHNAHRRLGARAVVGGHVALRDPRHDRRSRRRQGLRLLAVGLVHGRLLGHCAADLVHLVPGVDTGQLVFTPRVAHQGDQPLDRFHLRDLLRHSVAGHLEHHHRRGRGEHLEEREKQRGQGRAGAAENRPEDHGQSAAGVHGCRH